MPSHARFPSVRIPVPLAALGAAVLLAVPAQVQAQGAYAGKQVRIIVSSDPGGGYDTYARLLGRHLDRHLPGGPSVVIQNMPGAGGLRAAQFTYSAAPRDGTVLGNIRASSMLDSILGTRGTEIDPSKYEWIGSMAADTDVCSFWHTSGIKTFADLFEKEVLVGASGKGAQAYSFPNAINRVLGTKMKIILGYKGAADRILALEQGELQGNCGINGSTITANWAQLVSEGKLILVSQSGMRPYPTLPNVPLTQSFAKTEEQKEILDAIFGQMVIARAFAMPPGTDAARVAEMRKGFETALKDPRLLDDSKKVKLDIDPTFGDETAQMMAKLAAMKPDIKQKVKEAIGD